MKKTVIIGGGVAGLSLAIAMRKQGYEVVVCEREEQTHSNGHAFLIHPDAMTVLEKVVETDPYHLMPGRSIDKLLLKNSDDAVLQDIPLDGWVCMKRCEAMGALASQLPQGTIQYGRSFSHFIIHDEVVVAAAFTNGEVEYGDWFIGADGARSAVRKALFGPTEYTPVFVKEILGTINNKALFDRHPHMFTKYLCRDKGLAIGFIPCNDAELIWFLQFDVTLCTSDLSTPQGISDFCRSIVKEFPQEVSELMACESVVANYVWHTTDFEVMPTFSNRNVILLGDAAHVALPFTSAGVTNALLDVDCFMNALNEGLAFEEICQRVYNQRAPQVRNHVEIGREIRSSFLQGSDRSVKLPIIQDLKVLEH
ncbi:MAG: FAD-dependent oxidoreductase [Flavobacteriales bacterium]|jgi:2-polyprenyl-6-methoxyphenol hydroxylase-like FAD-dependent oxidoreductase